MLPLLLSLCASPSTLTCTVSIVYLYIKHAVCMESRLAQSSWASCLYRCVQSAWPFLHYSLTNAQQWSYISWAVSSFSCAVFLQAQCYLCCTAVVVQLEGHGVVAQILLCPDKILLDLTLLCTSTVRLLKTLKILWWLTTVQWSHVCLCVCVCVFAVDMRRMLGP